MHASAVLKILTGVSACVRGHVREQFCLFLISYVSVLYLSEAYDSIREQCF